MSVFKPRLARSLVLIGSLTGLAIVSVVIFRLTTTTIEPDQSRPAAVAPTPIAGSAAAAGLPMRLTIPTISVDAHIESVSLTTKGEMAAPKNPNNAAWYKYGPRPGENGSAVIDGHSGQTDGGLAVFDNIDRLHTGDKLYVEDARGKTVAFVVRTLRTYDSDDNARSVFVTSDNKSHLNLITCTGAWNTRARNYADRTVVFADRI